LHDDVEIPLERVSLFEVKSYDVGFSDKAIAVSAPMNREARQFAQKYAIQIIQIEQKPTATPATQPSAVKKAVVPAVKSTKIDDDKAPVARAKPTKLVPEVEALELIPEVMARRLNVIPISVANNTLTIVMADPTDVFALEAISASTKMRVKPLPAELTKSGKRSTLTIRVTAKLKNRFPMYPFQMKLPMSAWRWMPPSTPAGTSAQFDH